MNSTNAFGRNAGDFLTYIILPLTCVLLPYSWGQSLVKRIAEKGWLLEARSKAALKSARKYVRIPDPERWMVRWRLTEVIEARDLWMSILGRRGAALAAVRIVDIPSPEARQVMIGMHWGPSLLTLLLFRQAGLKPRFVFRVPEPEIRRVSPFYYFYLKILTSYIRRSCGGMGIEVPGAGDELVASLEAPGSPVILLDAPVSRTGNTLRGEILGIPAEFHRNGPELLVAGKARCILYSMGLDENGVNVLQCDESFVPTSAGELVSRYLGLMERCLSQDSAQWRLWHAAEQFFRAQDVRLDQASLQSKTQ